MGIENRQKCLGCITQSAAEHADALDRAIAFVFKAANDIELILDVNLRITVELATSPAQLEQGLMFRQSLPADAGMLFDFKAPQPAMMWMKNTLIPLDMLFVDGQGRIVSLHERAVPGSLETIGSGAPVRAVVELNGGTVARLGIKPGDRVLFPIFGNVS